MLEIKQLTSLEENTLQQIARLLGQLPQPEKDPAKLRAYIEKILSKGIVFVIQDENEIDGILGFYANDMVRKVSYGTCFVIDPKIRGQGWGKKMMHVFLSTAKEKGMREYSFVVVKTNTRAIKLYEKIGASIVGQAPDDPTRFLMKGPLT